MTDNILCFGHLNSFAFTLHDSLYCYGQRIVLTDGALPSIVYPPRWNLINNTEEWFHFAFEVDTKAFECSAFVNGQLFTKVSVKSRFPAPASGNLAPLRQLTLGQLTRTLLTPFRAATTPTDPPGTNSGNFFNLTRPQPRDFPIVQRVSFQGRMDEIRLWAMTRFDINMTNGNATTNEKSKGIKTLRRGLMPEELDQSSKLLAYWDIDNEPVGGIANINFTEINDKIGNSNGFFNSFRSSPFTFSEVAPVPTIAIGPSTAPIVTFNSSWNFHVPAREIEVSLGPFKFMCLVMEEYSETPCPTDDVAYYQYSITSQATAGVTRPASGQMTNSSIFVYIPLTFLLVQNNLQDSFTWATNAMIRDKPGLLGAPVRIFSPPAWSLYSPFSRHQQVSNFANVEGNNFDIFEKFYNYYYMSHSSYENNFDSEYGSSWRYLQVPHGNSPSILRLPCYSYFGAPVKPLILAAPSSSKLFQVQALAFQSGSLSIVPKRTQLLSCGDQTNPNPQCFVSSPTDAIFYSPMADPTLEDDANSMPLFINYTCVSDPFTFFMKPAVAAISTSKISEQISYRASMVGPNPFAVYFDGSYTELSSNTSNAFNVCAVSVWIRPNLNSEGFESSGSLESKVLLQMFPDDTLRQKFEIALVRNASSFPNYFAVITNFKSSFPSGYISVSTFTNSSLSSSVWIEPEKWTNILVTQSLSDPSLYTVYLDGSPTISIPFGAINPPAIIYLGAPVAAEEASNSNLTSYIGSLDELTFWSRPIASLDALTMQFEAVDQDSESLEAYWDFNEGVGFSAFDAKRNFVFSPKRRPISPIIAAMNASDLSPAQAMPQWVPATDLSFPSIPVKATTAKIITMATHGRGSEDKWKLGVFITQLPQNGDLYQVIESSSKREFFEGSLDAKSFLRDVKEAKRDIVAVKPINTAYSDSGTGPTLLRQWVSNVRAVSSSREAPPGTNFWNASHIVGSPVWWSSSTSSSNFNSKERYFDAKRFGREALESNQSPSSNSSSPSSSPGPNSPQSSSPTNAPSFASPQVSINPSTLQGGGRSDSLFSSTPPVYGPNVYSWCPASVCDISTSINAENGGKREFSNFSGISRDFSEFYEEFQTSFSSPEGQMLEWIEVEFDVEVYLKRVEVFQNLNPGSVTRIAAFDENFLKWRDLYTSEATMPGGVMVAAYATLSPQFCSYTSFKTRVIRLEMDTCKYRVWNQIEAVRLTGTTELPAGVVTDPEGRVLYVPRDVGAGADKISYTASSCPTSTAAISPSFTYNLYIGGATPQSPYGLSATYDVDARNYTLILLRAYSPDSRVTSFQRIVTSFPSKGSLYNAKFNAKTRLLEPADELESDEKEVLIENADGYLFYRAPDECKYEISSFTYYVTANGDRSSTSTIKLNSLCSHSFLNYTRWLAIILLVLTLLAMMVAIAFGVYVIVQRSERAIGEDRPIVLLTISIAALVSYASLFLEFAPVTSSWCLARLWILHLGTTLLVTCTLALALIKWSDFSAQALRSSNRRKESIYSLPLSAFLLGCLALGVEILQLIIFSVVDKPVVRYSVSHDNAAVTVATCSAPKFSFTLLVINKAAWLVAVFVICCILISVSTAGLGAYAFLLFSSVVAIFCGLAFIIAMYSTNSPSILLTLNVLALVIPISIFFASLFFAHLSYRRTHKIQNVVETTEFGLQPITSSSQKTTAAIMRGKSTSQLSDTAANVQMTIDMNNHSVDKSVAALLDTVQTKEREIADLKRRLLKRHYKIRALQQKLSETAESSNMQLFSAGPSDYTE